jgi:hypothetical protein
MTYFTQFDKRDYLFSDRVKKQVTNLSTYTAIFSRIADDISFYTYYNVRPDERLDTISHTLYGTVDYYWTIPLINSRIINVWGDMPRDTQMLQAYLQKKYPGSALIVSESDSLVGKFTLDELGVYDSDQVVQIIGKYPTRNFVHVLPVTSTSVSDLFSTPPDSGVLVGADSGDQVSVNIKIPTYMAPDHFLDSDGNRVTSTAASATEVSIQNVESDLNEQKSQIKVIRPEFIYDIVKRFGDEIRLSEEQRS